MIICKIVLLFFFVLIAVPGLFLVVKRTGDHNVDYFTKMLGAFLLALGCIGIAQTILSLMR